MSARRWVLAAVLTSLVPLAGAHELTPSECREGSDFIKNAALSRDYGISREMFLDRLRTDIVAIQAFPPELRWFVQDEDDETLLTGFARSVFDSPRAPEHHQSEFLVACMARIAAKPALGPRVVERTVEQ